MTSAKLRKIALYLEYIAFVMRDEAKENDARTKPKLTINERNRRISEGLRLSHARRRRAKRHV